MTDEMIVHPENAAPPHTEPSPALRDFRGAMFAVDSETMALALDEYGQKRKAFCDWLLSNLKEGIHFGNPPGCKPEMSEDGQFFKQKTSGGFTWVPIKQWTPRPSLYKAGADLICDLLYARDEYEADMNAWEQLGKPVGVFVMRCRLYSKTNGALIGEGMGCRAVKSSRMSEKENASIKLAKKSAKVDATLNAWGLTDLFTQDIEDADEPPHDNPPADPQAPKTVGRADRVTRDEVAGLCKRWLTWRKIVDAESGATQPSGTKPGFTQFVNGICNRAFDPDKWSLWTPHDIERVSAKLDEVGA